MEAVHLVRDFEDALRKQHSTREEWITLTFSPQQVRYLINVIKCTNEYARNADHRPDVICNIFDYQG